jgi:hypothetical protein
MRKLMNPEQNDMAVDVPMPTESGEAIYDPNDPLSQDAAAVDTSFPLLPTGIYDMEITDCGVGASKSKPENQVMTIKMATTQDVTDTKGEHLNKGFPIYYRIGITPTPDYDAKAIAKKLATVLKQCGVAQGITPRGFINDAKMVVGKVVRVKIAIQKETTDFPESNSVKSFVDVQ